VHIDFILINVKENIFIRRKGIKKKKDKFNISISKSSIKITLHKNNIAFKKVYKQINSYSENELKEKMKIK
jgi:hypothetical protein